MISKTIPYFPNETGLNIVTNTTSYYSNHIIPPLQNIISAIIIVICIYFIIIPLIWAIIYQIKYGDNYGDKYLRGEISKEEKTELKKHGFKRK